MAGMLLRGSRSLSWVLLSSSKSRIQVSSPTAQSLRLFCSKRWSSTSIDCALYPSARKDVTVVDDYHGTKVADPYRWMEDPDAAETKEFVDKLNAISAPYIEAAECREVFRKKMTELWDYEKFACTSKHGRYYYYEHNSGLQNQNVTFQQTALGEKGKVFFDPNALAEGGTTHLRCSSFARDGTIFAYGISEKGSDWTTIKFRTAEGEDLPDVIPGAKYTGISWIGDNSGVFYSRYPRHKGTTEGTEAEKLEFHSLYFHKMGTPASEDILVMNFPDNPEYFVSGYVTTDGRFLIVDVVRGCDPCNKLYYYDLQATGNKISGPISATPLFDRFDAKYTYVDHDGDTMYIRTNKGAPMFKLVKVSLSSGEDSAVDVILENARSTMQYAAPLIGGRLIVGYLEDVKAAVYMYELESGRRLYQIPVGENGTVTGMFVEKDNNELFFQFESFLVPMIEYRMDFTNCALDLMPPVQELRRTTVKDLEPELFDVKQYFYPSKDGTKIPMYCISPAGMERNGDAPVLLNGYGGFNIADVPYFSIDRLLWARHFGGVYAVANLRGGSEYGEKWHEAGMKAQKQNVFDDFIAAGEFLINEKISRAGRIIIQGGSNGGLLVGACSQQAPHLWGGAINHVGVLDMLRFHHFTIGAAWMTEYGNPDDPNDFKYIYKYSPLHNVAIPLDGQWPATLLLSADHDDRVVPSHTLKYIAMLYDRAREHGRQMNPILARIDVKAGHGAGKPTGKIIAESTDVFAFIQRVLDLKWTT